MAEDLGSVYADVQLRMNNLDKAIIQVSAKMDKLAEIMVKKSRKTSDDTNSLFARMGKKVNEAIANVSKSAAGQFANMAAGIQKALVAAPIIGSIMMIGSKIASGIAKWINETSQAYHAHQAELAKLNSVLNSTGSVAWTTAKDLEAMADSLENITGNNNDEIMRMQGVLLGFRSITGDTFERTTVAIMDMVAVMGGDLAGTANIVGKALDNPVMGMTALSKQGFIFSQATKDLVENLLNEGKVLEAQNIILEEMETSFGGAAKAMNEANAAQSRLANAADRLKKAQGEATHVFADWWANLRAGWKESWADAIEFENALREALNPDFSEFENKIEKLREKLKELLQEGNTEDALEVEKQIISIEYDVKVEKARHHLTLMQSDLKNAESAFKLVTTSAGSATSSMGTYTEAQKENARQMLLNAQTAEAAAAREVEAIRARVRELRAEGAERARQRGLFASEEEKMTMITTEREKVIKTAEQNETQQRKLQKAGLIDVKEMRANIAAGYKQEASALADLIVQTEAESFQTAGGLALRRGQLTALNTVLEDATKKYNEFHDAASGGGRSGGSRAGKDPLSALEIMNLEISAAQQLQRERFINEEEMNKRILAAREKFYENMEGLTSTKDGRTETQNEEMSLQFSIINEDKARAAIKELNTELAGMKMTEKELQAASRARAWQQIEDSAEYINLAEETKTAWKEAFDEIWDALQEKQSWDEFSQNAGSALQVFGNAISAVSELVSAASQKYIDQETDLLEKRNEAIKASLDKEMQDRLYALGLIEAATEEQYEKDLEKAIRTGDEKFILESQQALQKQKIEEEYAAKQQALEEETARKKAELEYKGEMSAWNMKVLSTIASVAQSILQATSTMPFFSWPVSIGVASAIGAVQLAAVRAAKPVKTYADGGIVPGNSYSGDNVPGMLNSREMVMTLQDQQNLFDFIRNLGSQSGGGGDLYLTLDLDGRPIAETVVNNYINNRRVLIKARSVV